MTEGRLRGASGSGLVEILVSVVILGIGVVGILSSLAFLFTASTRHRSLAESNTVALHALEYLADPERTPYEACPDAEGDQYQAELDAAVLPTAGWTVTVVAEAWNGAAWVACAGATDTGLQRLHATTADASGNTGAELELVKRRTS